MLVAKVGKVAGIHMEFGRASGIYFELVAEMQQVAAVEVVKNGGQLDLLRYVSLVDETELLR